ncbi:SDR family oxidoreductase [Patulibacter minatonensis]|uniref:SDR family oxidoreductase n=1 Tax=Patulibacter minatonensis TaxID=298163 RepID=UPI00047A6939|nr:SDR family oxidoreductase [Patulibacter minatonensis]
MRVFITGASGHIGSAVVPELLAAGHEVVGLARSDASAARLDAAGATALRGDLDDLDGLRGAAASADGVLHLAFRHDAMQSGDFEGAVASDLRAILAVGDALEGSGKPFVSTSGTLMLAFAGITGRAGTEEDAGEAGPRIDAENAVVALADRGVRSSVVRLPPLVHSDLDLHGFLPTLTGIARDTGVAGYLGDGANRWPAVHTLDAARIYRLALESAPAGTRLHAVDDTGVPTREIAEAIGRGLDLPTAGIAPEDAGHFGFLAPFVGMDNVVSASRTQDLLDWHPTGPGLLADLGAGHYFAGTGA